MTLAEPMLDARFWILVRVGALFHRESSIKASVMTEWNTKELIAADNQMPMNSARADDALIASKSTFPTVA